ncbi:DMT family transporter [Phytoactinopolyspora halotolerans]|uniref:Multidrug efflux SMR transporter n=1 Tax=Phytoactinopolyspora halotolerans TaxID=1981512 RepID=A0A6L9SGM0_9ACTN|nr:multidrug efflux SMR transporter [Phytoactinopolyspora halotolerans]NEE04426.1 multidrug efflux SMR transporter [Phytoactinopolyspora halotolerans]
MAWIVLIAAALLETVWAIALKKSDGFSHVWPSTIGIAAAVTSFVLLALALRSLPVGTAYAVWVGLGAAGVVAAGIAVFGDDASLLRIGAVALILIGVVGLRVLGE